MRWAATVTAPGRLGSEAVSRVCLPWLRGRRSECTAVRWWWWRVARVAEVYCEGQHGVRWFTGLLGDGWSAAQGGRMYRSREGEVGYSGHRRGERGHRADD